MDITRDHSIQNYIEKYIRMNSTSRIDDAKKCPNPLPCPLPCSLSWKRSENHNVLKNS